MRRCSQCASTDGSRGDTRCSHAHEPTRGSGFNSGPRFGFSGGSGGYYSGIEQTCTDGEFSDKDGAEEITCVNLSETTGGCSSSLDAGAIVLATGIAGSYFFTVPTNAKYKV